MRIVTLTSDWNESDYYIGAIKGKILSACKDVNIQDLNHRIRPFNVAHAAFVVRNCYHYYPEGTIHVIAVNSEPEAGKSILAAKIDEHFFICADNGILGLIAKNEPEEIVEISGGAGSNPGSFLSLSLITQAVCGIAAGKDLGEIGKKAEETNRRIPLRPTIEENSLIGSVIYRDSYANAITNISKELFERIGKNRKFEILVQSKHYIIRKLNQSYSETEPGDLLAIFNSTGLLEIAIRNGNAADLLRLNENSTIRIEFFEK